MATAAEPRADLPALTGLRGVAAWFVVLYHIRPGAAWALPESVTEILAKGYLAVDLFFMLSGFVLWLNYSDRLRADGLGAAPAFLARRIARIWPLHAFILANAVALTALLALTGRPPPGNYPWSELPLHLLLVQNWGLTDALSWNDPAWSISCEFAAYLAFPLIALAVNWRRFSTLALCGLALLLAFALHSAMAAGGADGLGDQITRFGLVRALFEFAIGTIVCALWERSRTGPRLPIALALAASAGFAVCWWAGAPETLAVPPMLAGLLLAAALAGSARNPLAWRPVHYLGEISYATYLVHFLLYILFKLLLVEDPAHVPLPLLGLFLVLTLAASVMLHHMVERPSQRALNRAFAALSPARAEPRPSRPA